MTDIATRLMPMPVTGEALDLAGPDEDLAAAFDHIRALEREAKTVRDAIGDELLARLDRNAHWTLRLAGGWTVTAPSPAPELDPDPLTLRAVLDELVTSGVITEVAADAACEPVVSYKPRKQGIKALLKVGGEVARRVAEACPEREPRRRVTVKPGRGA